jgi:chromate transporter
MEQELVIEPEQEIQSISFWQAFLFWLKLGFISFGGPAGQIAVMHQELVEQKRWISEKRFYMLSTTACYYPDLKHNN